ncbi:MAG: mechanosensitive ion channel family protein [Candidatus Nanohaloarchaea archaeon]|nr:mechanosensitive ion channel family protein [Candidatus Nanohaloarchaea archaeon]
MIERILPWMEANPGLAVAVKVVTVLIATYIAVKIFDEVLRRHFRRVSRQMDLEKTSYVLVRRLIRATIYIIGVSSAIYMIPSLRQLSVALFASAGFAGIIIGFAAREAFSNIISGIFIAIFQPFSVGDNIEIENYYGTVEDITLRQTLLKTPSNERVVFPNNTMLNSNLMNYSLREEKSRYEVRFMISYDSDIDRAKDIILEEAEEHELTEHGESSVIVKDLADSGVVLELRIWAGDRGNAWSAGQDLRESVKKRFDQEGIRIPFPQRTISYLEDLGDFSHG